MRGRAGSRGIVSRRRVLLALGSGVTLGGLTSTRAFDSVDADRTAQVDAVSDPNALLGLDGYGDASVTPTITNNSNYAMSITLDSPSSVEFDVGTDGSYVATPVTFSLAAGITTEVQIKYTGQCSGAGSATVNKSADLTDGGQTVGTVSLSRTWEIPQAGQIQISGNVTAAGNSGKYEFELGNTGCFDVTITGLGINETTNAAAANVGGGSILTVGGGGGPGNGNGGGGNQSIVSQSIPIDSTDPDGAAIVPFDTDVALAQNQTKTFEFDRFRDANDNKLGMKGEDVKITLQFSDGSTTVSRLCINGCSF